MSWVQYGRRREERRQRGGEGLALNYDSAIDRKIHRPSDEGLECHRGVPHHLGWPPEPQPKYPVQGQKKLSLPLTRISSLWWEEERRLPPQRDLSHGWHEERRSPPPPPRCPSPDLHEEQPLADSDTLPVRWRNPQPAKKEMCDTNQGQPTSKGARVHFQRLSERRQRIPEEEEEEGDDDEDGDDGEKAESGSSPSNSLIASMANVQKGKSRPDGRNLAMSDSFDFIELEGSGSADEDGFVHVPRGRPS